MTKAPALEIRLLLQHPALGWEYVTRLRGDLIDTGSDFSTPGDALRAALSAAKREVDAARGVLITKEHES